MSKPIGPAGLALIQRFEGCRLKAYKPIPTEKYWVNILATKRDGVQEPLPGPNHCFTADETIFILGGNKDLQKFLNL